MPSRNVVKEYVPGGIYHVYNRGVEKRTIFQGPGDYAVFLRVLRSYLLPPRHDSQSDASWRVRHIPGVYTLHERVELLAYCLMPNHFHLVLRQHDATGMSELLRRLSNAYVLYFNRHYSRIGALFQGRYRAVLVKDEGHLLQLTRYIHRNPLELSPKAGPASLAQYEYSSYPEYLGLRHTEWLHPDVVLERFLVFSGASPDAGTYRDYAEYDLADDRAALANSALD